MPSALSLPPFRPPAWARGGHAQTLLGVWLPDEAPELQPSANGAARDAERGVVRFDVTLADGDRLATLEARPEVVAEDAWVVHLFHGLTGSTSSGYMRRAAERFGALGHFVVAVNHRGAGIGTGLARGMYHSGVAHDVRAALAAGRARHPNRRHLAIGYSLSGNALLLALGRDRSNLPDAAIAVNPPVDLAGCVARLMRPANKLYDLNFVRGCSRLVEERVRLGLLPPQPSFGLRHTIRDFDELVTAPLAGFTGADDYYTRCSARPWLVSIDVPTVILTSRDDPLIDWRDAGEAPCSPRVGVHVVPHGGHMGYLARDGALGSRRWLEDALAITFERLLTCIGAA
jgi:predicted alpha/beta-fold hydrolase